MFKKWLAKNLFKYSLIKSISKQFHKHKLIKKDIDNFMS